MPSIEDMLDKLQGTMIFPRLDLRSRYHQICVRLDDEKNTVFKTKKGLYKWLVMLFQLCNAPDTFMMLINQVLKPFTNIFLVVYFNDILVHSKDEMSHIHHLKAILRAFRENKLYLNLKKCEFSSSKLLFLGFIISAVVIFVSPSYI